ncbi:MAG: hypothetical protein KDB80_02775 [Planctomycetes bacterium]|nr:hypothetical protein [Planctomycetota bacterium]
MDTSSINGINAGTGVLSTKSANYGDNPFLSLLVAEMRTQTPLEPVDNASFMQQMSSFSNMEQQQELNDNMLKLLDYQGVLARLQGLSEGSALLGKSVDFVADDGNDRSGVVDSVFVTEEGDVKLRIGSEELDMRRVTAIRTADATN